MASLLKYRNALFEVCLEERNAREGMKVMKESFCEASHDLAARTHSRKDINGNYCALVKVQLVVSDVGFGGNVVGDEQNGSAVRVKYTVPVTFKL